MSVSTIITGIETETQAALGSEYKPLSDVVVTDSNTFGSQKQRYGVLPKSLSETAGAMGSITVDQQFEITLTDSFAQTKIGTRGAREQAVALITKANAVYQRLARTKCGVPASVRLVSSLQISEPTYLDTKVVVIQMTVTVKYRT